MSQKPRDTKGKFTKTKNPKTKRIRVTKEEKKFIEDIRMDNQFLEFRNLAFEFADVSKTLAKEKEQTDKMLIQVLAWFTANASNIPADIRIKLFESFSDDQNKIMLNLRDEIEKTEVIFK